MLAVACGSPEPMAAVAPHRPAVTVAPSAEVASSASADVAPAEPAPAVEPTPTLPVDGLCVTARSGRASFHVFRREASVVTLRLERGDDPASLRFGAAAIEAAFVDPDGFHTSGPLYDLIPLHAVAVGHHRLDDAGRVVESAIVDRRFRRESTDIEYDPAGRRTFNRGDVLKYAGVDLKGPLPPPVLPFPMRLLGFEFSGLVSMGFVEMLQGARRPFAGTLTTTRHLAGEPKSKDVVRFDAKGRAQGAVSFDIDPDGVSEELAKMQWRWEGEEAVELRITAQAPGERAMATYRFAWADGRLMALEEQWTESKDGETVTKPASSLAELSYDAEGRLSRLNGTSFEYAPGWDRCAAVVW